MILNLVLPQNCSQPLVKINLKYIHWNRGHTCGSLWGFQFTFSKFVGLDAFREILRKEVKNFVENYIYQDCLFRGEIFFPHALNNEFLLLSLASIFVQKMVIFPSDWQLQYWEKYLSWSSARDFTSSSRSSSIPIERCSSSTSCTKLCSSRSRRQSVLTFLIEQSAELL